MMIMGVIFFVSKIECEIFNWEISWFKMQYLPVNDSTIDQDKQSCCLERCCSQKIIFCFLILFLICVPIVLGIVLPIYYNQDNSWIIYVSLIITGELLIYPMIVYIIAIRRTSTYTLDTLISAMGKHK